MSELHMNLAAFNLSEWIGPAFVALFFFVLPILRAMKESKEKQKQLDAKRESAGQSPQLAGETAEDDLDAARKKWEALLRGEEVEPTPYTPPVSRQPEVARSAPQSATSSEAPPATLAGNLSPFEATPSEDEMETTFAEERMAQVDNEARLREEMQRRNAFLFAEREGAPVRADVATAIAPDRAADAVAVAPDVTRRRDVFGAGPGGGLGSRSALRRAILASEVFGRPVGLRDGSDQVGPLSARH